MSLGPVDGDGYALNARGRRTYLAIIDKLEVSRQGRIVRHLCGHRRCLNPGHYALGDHLDNARDRELHGRTVKGARHPASKLAPYVPEIRARHEAGEGYKKLANEYGVSKNAIVKLVKGVTYTPG